MHMIIFILLLSSTNALECLECVDGTVANISALDTAIRQVVKNQEQRLRTPECATATTATEGTSGNVTLRTCTNDPGYGNEHRCGTFTGRLKLEMFGIQIPVNIVYRGCFGVKPSLGAICLTDENMLNREKARLEEIYGSRIEPLKIGEATGKFCFNGSVKFSVTLSLYFMLFVIILVLHSY